jgi:glutamyl-tRNA reductase
VPVQPESVVRALQRKADAVAEAELGRLASRAPTLDASTRKEVSEAVHRVVETFLKDAITRVTNHADSPLGDSYADALRELFSLALDHPVLEQPVRRAG